MWSKLILEINDSAIGGILHLNGIHELTHSFYLQESYNIDEITKGFSDIVISETHVISEGKITSKLKLHMNLTSNDFFKCEFAMMDSTIFSEAVKIDFEGKLFLVHIDISLKYRLKANPLEVNVVFQNLTTFCEIGGIDI